MSCPAVILDGKAVAQDILQESKDKLSAWGNPAITLVTVLVGNSAPSRLYVNLKLQNAKEVGLRTRLLELPASIGQKNLQVAMQELADDKQVHAILLQLPLPQGLDASPILQIIPPEKDVDGLSHVNLGKLISGHGQLVPCTPLGVMQILKHYKIDTCGKRAVVIGRSYLAGLPQMLLLSSKNANATVTLCHSKTTNLQTICQQADILVSASGVAKSITADHVKAGAAVIDIGVTRTDNGIQGDVCFDQVFEKAGWITPMPGGTGPVTVACLIKNTLIAAELQNAV